MSSSMRRSLFGAPMVIWSQTQHGCWTIKFLRRWHTRFSLTKTACTWKYMSMFTWHSQSSAGHDVAEALVPRPLRPCKCRCCDRGSPSDWWRPGGVAMPSSPSCATSGSLACRERCRRRRPKSIELSRVLNWGKRELMQYVQRWHQPNDLPPKSRSLVELKLIFWRRLNSAKILSCQRVSCCTHTAKGKRQADSTKHFRSNVFFCLRRYNVLERCACPVRNITYTLYLSRFHTHAHMMSPGEKLRNTADSKKKGQCFRSKSIALRVRHTKIGIFWNPYDKRKQNKSLSFQHFVYLTSKSWIDKSKKLQFRHPESQKQFEI